ncbi:MAG: hypothetical protein NZM12_02710, partial [Steroidobacteraceae bacterium]|nr:hypothetical protein [Steroidobacteraceae bacterium]
MVTNAIADIASNRQQIIDTIDGFDAAGFTPLSETLFEAQQYFSGREVVYGLESTVDDGATPFPSVPESRRSDDPSRYRSPIEYQCQKNYAILLTDGEPTWDNSADDLIAALPNFGSLVGDCGDPGVWGRCLDDVAAYMFRADLSPLPGQQNVVTYTVGFGPEVAGSAFLDVVAARGGGRAFEAGDITELTAALRQIFSEIQQSNGVFATPTVSINAFNRTQSTNEFYVSVFKPTDRMHWPGNVKKYQIRNGAIVDAAGRPAVDPETGFFRDGIRSFWSPRDDGANIELGGAVSRQPPPSQRKVLTYLASSGTRDLNAPGNRFVATNSALTAELLGVGASGASR